MEKQQLEISLDSDLAAGRSYVDRTLFFNDAGCTSANTGNFASTTCDFYLGDDVTEALPDGKLVTRFRLGSSC